MSSTLTCLQDVLYTRAKADNPGRLVFYENGNTTNPRDVSYNDLYHQAQEASAILRRLETFNSHKPILIHLDNHWDTTLWFWAALLADGLPVLSPAFSNVEDHRRKHIKGLATLLEAPICITRTEAVPLFGDDHGLHIHTIESLLDAPITITPTLSWNGADMWTASHMTRSDSLAMLMLTSGSTGNAKAVRLTHRQALASVAGKLSTRALPPDKPFLNWIGLDHVGALLEIHLLALWHGVGQVHVSTTDVVSSPRISLDLLSRHQVSRSFAPNFFLARLVSEVTRLELERPEPSWDLSNLIFLGSGGEANDVRTCLEISTALTKYGAPSNVIVPGFGMTETCAGSIYHVNCPKDDLENNRVVACLGKCVKGIEMRIAMPGTTERTIPGETGELQVRGPIVFEGYYRNSSATAKSFTPDGWFRTGDQAIIDANENLCLIGRVEDVININGRKLIAADLQMDLEQALGSLVSRIIAFPTRAAHTEQITICYIPRGWPEEAIEAAKVNVLAQKVCMLSAASHPLVFSVQEQSQALLPISSLGKISRAKMRFLVEAGRFDQDITLHNHAVQRTKDETREIYKSQEPASDAEAGFIQDIAGVLGISPAIIDVDTPLFELGFTSLHLIALKNRIDKRLKTTVPLLIILKNATARALAAATTPKKKAAQVSTYDPVVLFQPLGQKTPLWLIHPGVGEVLVFVGLVQQMGVNRPLYALRARGFEEDQTCFTSIGQTVDAYVAAIRRNQPEGPYALAGYSYGAMLAFEVAKKLDPAADGTVSFLGSFNLPPHIKARMRKLDWNMCLLHLAYFIGLITETFIDGIDHQAFSGLTRQEALDRILRDANTARMEELELHLPDLCRWVDVAYGLQSMAVDYDPAGQVHSIDVFHCEPLKVAAPSAEVWMRDHLSHWSSFSRSPPAYHHVPGAHYTMLSPAHVVEFSKTLSSALTARGI